MLHVGSLYGDHALLLWFNRLGSDGGVMMLPKSKKEGRTGWRGASATAWNMETQTMKKFKVKEMDID